MELRFLKLAGLYCQWLHSMKVLKYFGIRSQNKNISGFRNVVKNKGELLRKKKPRQNIELNFS